MSLPKVSVIVPAYNAGLYLKGTLQSVLAQTYLPDEIIVVNDGSTDATEQVALQYGDRIKYLYQENAGPAAARNRGVAQAQGDYLALLDGDDLWLPNFLQSLLGLAQSQPEAAGFYGWAQMVTAQGQPLPQLAGAQQYRPNQLYQALLRANFLIPSTMLLRKSAVLEAGSFDPAPVLRGVEDWDLWLRLSRTQSLVCHPVPVAQYRVHTDSLSANPLRMQQATQALLVKHFGPDDSEPNQWSGDKQIAYGGYYRFCALTSVTKQKDWGGAATFLTKALAINPALATDMDLFYEFALGSQPLGYRGTSQLLELEQNASHLASLLTACAAPSKLRATAYYALGLVAYNTRHFRQVRGFLAQAASAQPGLWVQPRFLSTFLKSLVR